MLADRVGRRATFTGLMLVVAVPTALVATAWNYHTLLFVTFFLGLAGFLLCGRSRIRFSQIRASTTGHNGGDLRRRSEQGFRKATWDEALDFTVQKLPEIQERYGKDTVAVYGGARSFKAIHDPTTAVNPAVP
jgi:hypothetical protein